MLKRQYKVRMQRMLYNAIKSDKEHIFKTVNYIKGVIICVKNRFIAKKRTISQSLRIRIKEHLANINSNKSATSFADHSIKNNHC